MFERRGALLTLNRYCRGSCDATGTTRVLYCYLLGMTLAPRWCAAGTVPRCTGPVRRLHG